MAYRNIFIQNPAKLSLKNGQLTVNGGEYTFPVEDISTIMIENQQTNITSALLAECASQGVLVYLCDSKHQPCGVVTGYNNHSRKLKIMQAQIGLKQSLQKSLWQHIVTGKIKNQAKVLALLGLNGTDDIMLISKMVKSNDSDNMEAVAASKYFKYLFGDDFSRGQDNIINARLNYGYAIVRGLVCRSLASYGFEPCLGIHHQNQLNQFNLADDVIEPFRPIVDLCVYQMGTAENETLTVKDKQMLYNLINCDVLYKNQKNPLSYGIEKMVQTLQASYLEGKNKLILCELINLQQHEYE